MKSRALYIKETLLDIKEAFAVLEYSTEQTAQRYYDGILKAMQDDESMHPKTREMIKQHVMRAPEEQKIQFVSMLIHDLEEVDPTGTSSDASVTLDSDDHVFVGLTQAQVEEGQSLDGVTGYKDFKTVVDLKQQGLIEIILKVKYDPAKKIRDTIVIEDFSEATVVGQVGGLKKSVGKKYVPFLVKHYTLSGKEFGFFVGQEMREYLEDFEMLKNKKLLGSHSADILSYKTIEDFMKAVDEQRPLLVRKKEQEDTKKGNASYEYEDSEVRIIIPEDRQAACYYGRGTVWCTSGLVHNEFEEYNNLGTIFILIPKKPAYDYEKYQIFFGGGSKAPEFKNESEKAVDDLWLLSERFGNLISKYFAQQPEYKHWVENF
jgi:hypothetical protein